MRGIHLLVVLLLTLWVAAIPPASATFGIREGRKLLGVDDDDDESYVDSGADSGDDDDDGGDYDDGGDDDGYDDDGYDDDGNDDDGYDDDGYDDDSYDDDSYDDDSYDGGVDVTNWSSVLFGAPNDDDDEYWTDAFSALVGADDDTDWTHTYSVVDSGTVSSDDNALGAAGARAIGDNGYTVIHTATADEDDDFAASVSTSFTTFDPRYKALVDYQAGDDDDDGNALYPLPTEGAWAIASASAYGEDRSAQTAAITNGYLAPGSSDPIYNARAHGTALGERTDTKTFAYTPYEA